MKTCQNIIIPPSIFAYLGRSNTMMRQTSLGGKCQAEFVNVDCMTLHNNCKRCWMISNDLSNMETLDLGGKVMSGCGRWKKP